MSAIGFRPLLTIGLSSACGLSAKLRLEAGSPLAEPERTGFAQPEFFSF